MKNKRLVKSVSYSLFAFLFVLIGLSQQVDADTITAGSGNRIPFINTKAKSGSDAILLESNGHYALIDMGEDYDFPDGSDPRYPSRWGISMRNYQVLEDRLIRHLDQIGVKKLDFIIGTHVHSDHIGGADEILNRYQVGKFYLKKYSDDRITANWGLWDNLFNYDNALRAAQKRGVAAVKPGVRFCDIDAACRDFISEKRYGEIFTHPTGHHIGLECHEYGDISSINETKCEPGMIFSIEPGIYLPGEFGVRIEDLVLVTEDGCEVLNKLNKELVIIGE